MKIRHIFFDLDNTLWDHHKNAKLTLEELFSEENITEKYALSFESFYPVYYRINEELWDQLRDGAIDKAFLRKHRFYNVFLALGIDDFILSQRLEKHFLERILSHNHLLPSAIETLSYLKGKGYFLHILTNGFSEVTYRKIELSGIEKYFDTITCADEIEIRKPSGEIFDWAFQKAKSSKKEAVMIGDDWIADVEGAKSFGIEWVYFCPQSPAINDTPQTIKNLLDLKKIL